MFDYDFNSTARNSVKTNYFDKRNVSTNTRYENKG